jgi:hypothetical protein
MLAPPRPPSHDELEALIKEARARQLRRRYLGAAAIATVAAIGLGAYALTYTGSQRATTGSSPGAAVPVCRSSQLSASIGFGAATGSLLGGASITNTGGTRCALPRGRPALVITHRGQRLKVVEQIPPHPFPGRPSRLLEAGGKAIVWMQWFNWCGKPFVPVRFTFLFRGTEVSTNEQGLPRCDSSQAPSSAYVSLPLRPQ